MDVISDLTRRGLSRLRGGVRRNIDDGELAKMTVSSNLHGLAQALGKRAERDAPLASYTAMRVGGPADLLVVCESVS